MNNKGYSALFFLLMALFFTACGQKEDLRSNLVHKKSISQQILFRENQITEQGPYWTVFLTDQRYGYVLYDENGEEFLRDSTPGMFGIEMLNDSLLQLSISNGNGPPISRFYSISGSYSGEYSDVVAIGYGKIAYRSWERDTLIVHEIFAPGSKHDDFKRDFMKETPIDEKRRFPFDVVEFVDENHLRMEYLNSKGELIKELLELK